MSAFDLSSADARPRGGCHARAGRAGGLTLALALAAAAGVGCDRGAPAATVGHETHRVARRDLRDVLTRIGTVQALRTVEIKSEASGRIESLAVKEGQSVRAGDVLLRLDPRLIELQKKRLELALQAARLDRSKAQRDFDSAAQLIGAAALARLPFEDLRDALQRASIREREIELQIEETDEQLRKTVIRAPLTGVLTNLYVEEGEIAVAAASGLQGGTSIARMIDVDHLEVLTQISEVDYVRLRRGQPVTVRPEAFPDTHTPGHIAFLALSAKRASERELGAFEVRIAIDAPVPGMLPGANVSVEFLMLEKKDVLAVPCHFVELVDGGHWVHVPAGDGGPRATPVKRAVRVGATDFKHYEILSGVSEGELLLLPGAP